MGSLFCVERGKRFRPNKVMASSGGFNILYYSKFCNHSNKVIEYLAKNGYTAELNCICIDRRTTDGGNQVIVQLENGKQEKLPPMIDRVPALLLVKEKYQIRYGLDIMNYYKAAVPVGEDAKTVEGEPLAFSSSGFSSSFSAY